MAPITTHRRCPARSIRVPAIIVVTTVLAAGASTQTAHAACNLIPVAGKRFPSTLGAVESPITAPGKTVVVRLGGCDASLGFEETPSSNNTVMLTFEPPAGPPTDVPISGFSLDDCTAGRCRTLSFTVPTTTAEAPPYGLAGPARITVRDSGTVLVAEIGELFLPRFAGCDLQPEPVFEQLTVLPPSNLFADIASGAATEVLATVDGRNDLLVPLDYWGNGGASVLAETPGAPVAIFLQGGATLAAQGAGDPDSILDVLAAQPKPSDFVRSFTLDGRPLPPLLRVTSSGRLYGTADAVESVLRIAVNDGKGGPDLFDLTDRLFAGRGPVVISVFNAAVDHPVPLESLESSVQTVVFARDETREAANLNASSGDLDTSDFVAEVVEGDTGMSTSTEKAVTMLPRGVFVAPALMTAHGHAAFLESELDQNDTDLDGDGDTSGNILRVLDPQGNDLTAPAGLRDAAIGPFVDGRRIAISGSKTFFRQPGAFVEAYFDGVNGITGLVGVNDVAFSPGGEHVYVTSLFDNAVVVFSRDASSGVLSYVEMEVEGVGGIDSLNSANGVLVSPDGKYVYVSAGADRAITVFSRNPTTGALTYVAQERDVTDNQSTAYVDDVAISPDGANLYIVSHEDGLRSVNNAVSVYSRNATTGLISFVQVEFDGQGAASGDWIAQSVTVSPDGKNVYVPGAVDFGGSHGTVSVFSRDLATGELTYLEHETQGMDGVDGIDGAQDLALSPDGAHVYVAASSSRAVAAFRRDPVTGALTFVEAEFEDTVSVDGRRWFPSGVAVTPDGTRVYVGGSVDGIVARFGRNAATGELDLEEVYVDGIASVAGVFDARELAVSPDNRHLYVCDFQENALSVFRTQQNLGILDVNGPSFLSPEPAATRVATASDRALLLVPEPYVSTTNIDQVVHLYDATGPTPALTSLGVAGAQVAISDSVAAMTVREFNQNEIRNDDGDLLDDVLAVVDLASISSPLNTKLAADAIAVAGRHVILTTPESHEGATGIGCGPTVPPGGCDLNGDGDATDRVIRIYDQATGEVSEIAQAAEEFVIGGTLVAFRTSEAAQGGSNLNGDGDLVNTDAVMQVYDLATGELVNTGMAASLCELPGCDPTLPYKIKGDTVSFLTDEQDQGGDLNGDGDSDDIVLTVFNVYSRRVQIAATVVDDASGPAPVVPNVAPLPIEDVGEGTTVLMEAKESNLGEDVNGDGMVTDDVVVVIAGDVDEDGTFDDFDTCVATANGDQIDIDGDGLGDSACDPDPTPCPSVPLAGCRLTTRPGKAKLALKHRAGNESKDALKWKWSSGQATVLADYGSPVGGVAAYSVCMYDASGNAQPLLAAAVLPTAGCGSKPCWRATGTKGYKFKDKTGVQGGVAGIVLKAGAEGKAKIGVKGRGQNLGVRDLPFTTPVTLQLIVSEATRTACWEATYSTFKKNDAGQFKASAD